MRISLAWVGEFVDLSGVTAGQAAELLSLHTCEVEGVEDFGAELRDVLVGEVVSCEKHPNADKLALARVATGSGAPVQVVCGAPNVRRGLKVAFAPAGGTLPGGIRLKKEKIRGCESAGMICSERELGLGEEHGGIVALPESAPVGRPLADFLGLRDSVLVVDNKSITHRPDLWGHYGVARELAAILRRSLRSLPGPRPWPAGSAGVAIELADPASCPLYLGLAVDLGGPPAASPPSLRSRLLAVGQRPLNDVVDLTNYVLHELGQPTHAFDLARLRGPCVRVRRAASGERLRTLDGVERSLAPEDLVIADAGRAVALAGVMGGEEAEVSGTTAAILLESAVFLPSRVRRTAQRLGLRTEASARFEKSLDPTLAELALQRFAALLAEVRPQARVLGPPACAGGAEALRIRIPLEPELAAGRLGLPLTRAEVAEPLRALGFEVEDRGSGALQVAVPSWRATKDVTTPVDLVEEVGRLAGYHRIRPRAMEAPVEPPLQDPLRLLGRRLMDRLVHAHGGAETLGYSFLDRRWAARLHLPLEAFVRLANPAQEGVDLLRRDPIPTLLLQAAGNVREFPEGLLVEAGKGYEPRPPGAEEGNLPHERAWIGAVLWRRGPLPADGPASVFGHARAIAEDLLRASGLAGAFRCESVADRYLAPWGHPARLLGWSCETSTLGFTGCVDPRLLVELDLRRCEVGAMLLDLESLTRCAAGRLPRFRPPGRYPAVKVDVALAVPEEVPYARVEEAVRQAGGRLLEELELFDVFRGAPLPAGVRSLAFHAVLRSVERTLDEADERKFLDRVARAAQDAGGTLRRQEAGQGEPGGGQGS